MIGRLRRAGTLRLLRTAALSLALCAGSAGRAGDLAAQDARRGQGVDAARTPTPFGVGERLVYEVKFGGIKVGTGSMEVLDTSVVRGRQAYHTVFRVKGGTFFYRVDDKYESWFDTRTLASLRFRQDQDEGSYERERTFEIFPERATYREDDKPERPSVSQPLDDGSFLYFVRTIPLEVGRTYEFDNYFRPDRNPVKIVVLRREQVQVPAGTFDAIVVQPIIKTKKGIFGEGGHAEVWLADDPTRMMLQMTSKLKIGSLSLHLKSVRPPAVPVVAGAGSR